MLATACLAICAVVLIFGRSATRADGRFRIGVLNYLSRAEGHHQPVHDGGKPGDRGGARRSAAIVTICLALGMQQMIKRNALIRKLRHGDARLRDGNLLRQDRHADTERDDGSPGLDCGQRFKVTGEGYTPSGNSARRQALRDWRRSGCEALLHGALLCNDAALDRKTDESGTQSWRIIGDPRRARWRWWG